MTLVPNRFGRAKAARFRARFQLATFDIQNGDVDYCDVHDYLHTVVGALPVWQDEPRVYAIEDAIRSGRHPLPRGLDEVGARVKHVAAIRSSIVRDSWQASEVFSDAAQRGPIRRYGHRR